MRFPILLLAPLAVLASCVAPPREAPVQAPRPAPTPAPVPAPAPSPPPSRDWRDWPLSAGGWRYQPQGGSSAAIFGVAGGPALLTIRCEMPARRIIFVPASAPSAGQMTVRTTFGAVQWPLQSSAANGTQFVAVRAAGDAALDQIAFSRGRFVMEVPGAAPLVLPTWAEITRVIEDCRG